MKEDFLAKWQGVVQRGLRWSATSSILLQVFSLAKAIVIGRVLGAEAIGLYALLQIATTFGSRFSDLGLSNSVIHYRELSRAQLGGLYIINLLGGLLVALLVVAVGTWFFPELAIYLPFVGLTIFLKALAQQYQYLLQRDHNLKAISVLELISVGIGELACMLMLLLSFGLWAVVWGIALTAFVYLLGFSIVGIRTYGVPEVHRASFVDFKKLFRWGLFQMGEGLLGYWGQRADRIILVTLAGLEFLGFYTLAIQLITKPYQFVSSITSRVFQPIYASLSDKKAEINQIYLNNTKAIAALLFPIYGLMGMQAEWITYSLYGSGWEAVVPLLQILSFLGAAKAIYVSIGSYLLGIGKPDLGFYLNIYNSILAIGLISIGLAFFDPTQGVFIYAIGVSILAMPADLYIRQKGSNMLVRPFLVTLIRISAISFIGIAGASMLSSLINVEGWQQSVLEVGVFSVLVSSLSFRFVFNSSFVELKKAMWLGGKFRKDLKAQE